MAINSISSNIAAYSAQGNIGRASDKTSSSIDRLSSGNRIVRSSDDVSALVTGTVLRSTVTTLKQAFLNANQGSSMLQVADGALSQVTDILQRQKTLAVQAGSGSISDSERVFLNTEFQSLTDEINRIASNTRFSSVKLLNGSLSGSQALTTYAVPADTGSVAATGNITFAANPTNGDTITLNGVVWTFVAGAPTGNQTQIGANLNATLTQLAADLNASIDASISAATYANAGGTQLGITHDILGTQGNSFALASSSINGVVSGANLTNGRTSTPASSTIVQPTATNGIDTSLMNGIASVQSTLADGDQITINGYTITFTNSAQGTPAATGKVSIVFDNSGGIDRQSTSDNLAAFLNSSNDARIANLKFSTIAVSGNGGVGIDHYALVANWAGGALQGPYTINVTTSNGNIKVGDTFQRTIGNTATVGFSYISTANASTTDAYYFGGITGTNAGTSFAVGFTSVATDTSKVLIGTNATETAANLATFLNRSTDTRVKDFRFINRGNELVVDTKTTILNTAQTLYATVGSAYAIGNLNFTANPTNGQTAVINGVTWTFVTGAPVGNQTQIGATLDATLTQLATDLNASANASISVATYSHTAGSSVLNIAHDTLGTSGTTFTLAAGTAPYTTSGANLSNIPSIGLIAGTGSALTINTGGAIFSRDGLALNRTVALGEISGSILVNSSSTNGTHGNPIDLSWVQNNPDFIGKIGKGKIGNLTGSYSGVVDQAIFSLKVGDIIYSTQATTITDPTNPVPLTFTGKDAGGNPAGGQFTINLRASIIGVGTINGQGNLDPIVKQINDALSSVTFNQNRTISSFQEGETVKVAGVDIGTIDGMSTCLRTSNFTDVNIESIKIYAPSAGSSDARFEISVNGQTYISVAGIGNQITTNTSIVLQSTSNLQDVITLQTGNTGLASNSSLAMDLSSQTNADAITRTLEKAYGLSAGSSKVSFQIGSSADDSLGVRIDNISTNRIYKGNDLSIATKVEASLSNDVIDEAITIIASVRASIGALQSRFDFAAVNIQASLQNQDAARGALLDTDMTAESTAFATAQVQLQAGIAVLAQANQLPQGLLKLLG